MNFPQKLYHNLEHAIVVIFTWNEDMYLDKYIIFLVGAHYMSSGNVFMKEIVRNKKLQPSAPRFKT